MKRKGKNWLQRSPVPLATWYGIFAVLFFSIGLILVFASFGKAGVAGSKLFQWLAALIGVGFYFLPILFFFLCFASLKAIRDFFPIKKTAGIFVLYFSSLGIITSIFPEKGGVAGRTLTAPLIHFFDIYTSLILLATLFIISLLVIFDTSASSLLSLTWLRRFRHGRPEEEFTQHEAFITKPEEEMTVASVRRTKENAERLQEEGEEPPFFKEKDNKEILIPNSAQSRYLHKEVYTPPPLSLLETDRGKPGVGDIKANANIIKRTLQNFGVEVEVDEISIGPSVTRYALKPAESVRLSKIVALQRELELALAAHPIRIEAPIPGRSQVGIEIPNQIKAVVGLATMLANAEFVSSEKPLLLSLGKDLTGKAHFANLSKMPHLLIAGATGSGKSVTIHTLITSLLFRNSPNDLKFILIDPKRVELTLYNKIPHLLTPVITEMKKAILALKWAGKEMDRRYDILESESVRDIQSYHKNIKNPELPLPYIVIVIDELADIMTTYPRELETAVVRLAQMSRAVGIHLILSTQRPSVNVITGLIKANVPARIALQVSSQIDSRTILDGAGAEKLLGAGDMLFLSGEMSKPARLQSAFMSENEVKKVANWLAREYRDEPPGDLALGTKENSDNTGVFESLAGGDEIDDELYEDAREAVLKAGRASTSYLQRKLRVGYARAARLVDMLEERNVIGAADGSKPREVLGAAGHDVPPEENSEAPGPGQL